MWFGLEEKKVLTHVRDKKAEKENALMRAEDFMEELKTKKIYRKPARRQLARESWQPARRPKEKSGRHMHMHHDTSMARLVARVVQATVSAGVAVGAAAGVLVGGLKVRVLTPCENSVPRVEGCCIGP